MAITTSPDISAAVEAASDAENTRLAVEAAAANYQDLADTVSRLKAEVTEAEELLRAARQELVLALCPVLHDQTAIVIPYVYSKGGPMAILATKTVAGIVVETIPRLHS
jgi:hypothetical protein